MANHNDLPIKSCNHYAGNQPDDGQPETRFDAQTELPRQPDDRPGSLTSRERDILDELRQRGFDVTRAMLACRRERWTHSRAIVRQPEGGGVW